MSGFRVEFNVNVSWLSFVPPKRMVNAIDVTVNNVSGNFLVFATFALRCMLLQLIV
jgi:hypothetical protein